MSGLKLNKVINRSMSLEISRWKRSQLRIYNYPMWQPDEVKTGFKTYLDRNIPAHVSKRIRPLQESLRDKTFADEDNKILQSAIKEYTSEYVFLHEINVWGKDFISLVKTTGLTTSVFMQRLHEPPLEPVGVWDYLISHSDYEGVHGLAACVLLYNMGSARAVREFKQVYNIYT